METGACVSAAARGIARMPLISPAQSHFLSQLPLPFVPSRNNKAFIAAPFSADTTTARVPLVSAASPFSFKQIIEGLIEKVDLTEEEAEASVDLLLEEQNEALISHKRIFCASTSQRGDLSRNCGAGSGDV